MAGLGGGRTVDTRSTSCSPGSDRDRLLQGGAIGQRTPGMKAFPYFATPNTEIQETVAGSVELAR